MGNAPKSISARPLDLPIFNLAGQEPERQTLQRCLSPSQYPLHNPEGLSASVFYFPWIWRMFFYF